ncbi:hypothetical protein [Alteromonas gilva]|uniref:Uncharacterized protein n=1 Tax=Alteromonas gilva TaxID=2987522 RepID=A0ABT5KY77_9ALTE|nr:hypothetical protein [Alteromonas gilva]MDC8829729.1 hypothetical protein [Alteromonas gilva]
MRKILMNEKGEFDNSEKTDFLMAKAVKLMAAVIKNSEDEETRERVVVTGRVTEKVEQQG